MMGSSSSDEDDEVTRRVREAASEELIFHMKNREEKVESMAKPKGSERNPKQATKNNHHELVTTPEFRDHVAKKLSAFLDRMLESSSKCCMTSRQEVGRTEENIGIRLLSSSENLLTDADETKLYETPRKREQNMPSDESSSDEEREKFAAICVSGESILRSGEGAFKRKFSSNTATGTPKISDMDKTNDDDNSGKMTKKKRKTGNGSIT